MDQHTASGTAEQSEVHVVRAVETGIINVRPYLLDYCAPPLTIMAASRQLGLTIQESQEKLDRLSHSQ